jgi:hypothetical protein
VKAKLKCTNEPDGAASSDDDNIPIADTLPAKSKSLTLLATLASQPTSSPNGRKKKEKKHSGHTRQ